MAEHAGEDPMALPMPSSFYEGRSPTTIKSPWDGLTQVEPAEAMKMGLSGLENSLVRHVYTRRLIICSLSVVFLRIGKYLVMEFFLK